MVNKIKTSFQETVWCCLLLEVDAVFDDAGFCNTILCHKMYRTFCIKYILRHNLINLFHLRQRENNLVDNNCHELFWCIKYLMFLFPIVVWIALWNLITVHLKINISYDTWYEITAKIVTKNKINNFPVALFLYEHLTRMSCHMKQRV